MFATEGGLLPRSLFCLGRSRPSPTRIGLSLQTLLTSLRYNASFGRSSAAGQVFSRSRRQIIGITEIPNVKKVSFGSATDLSVLDEKRATRKLSFSARGRLG